MRSAVYLDEKLAELKRIVTGIESQIATLTAYRKSLIHECVTGQRRITEADVAAAQQGRYRRSIQADTKFDVAPLWSSR